jgi:hypothetical protein
MRKGIPLSKSINSTKCATETFPSARISIIYVTCAQPELKRPMYGPHAECRGRRVVSAISTLDSQYSRIDVFNTFMPAVGSRCHQQSWRLS